MLFVTATDMAVLCGNHGEACWTKYGSYPLHAKYCHEQAVRIVLAAVENAAARHKRHIVPVLSCSIDFYVRMRAPFLLPLPALLAAASTPEAAMRRGALLCLRWSSYWNEGMGHSPEAQVRTPLAIGSAAVEQGASA